MKKILLPIIAVGIISQSCEKEVPNEALNDSGFGTTAVDQNSSNKSASSSANSGQIFLENGVLCFNTIGYYESIVNFGDDSKVLGVTEFVGQLDFTSFNESRPTGDILEDNFVGTILNSDLIVKIGEWFIKINKNSSLVFVCSDEVSGAYQLVRDERSNDINVLTFSTDDDVLEELKDMGNNGQAGGKAPCYETSANSNNVTHAWDEYCDGYEVKFRSAYDSYGIIKKLKLEFWHNKKFGSPDQTSFTIGYRYKWKKKCKNETADVTHALLYSPPIYSWEFTNDHLQLTFYSGTHSLSKYYIGNASQTGGPTVAYQDKCDNTTNTISLVNALNHGY